MRLNWVVAVAIAGSGVYLAHSREEFRVLAALLVLASLLVSGCAFYNHPYPQPDLSNQRYELHTVQIDDFGTFWDAKQANALLDDVATGADQGNTFVYVFIHGWHHNASPDDPNLHDFNQLLGVLDRKLSTDARRDLRGRLTGSKDYRLIGIYLGWRGRSLPGVLDYGTMWWRKAAAERVGDGAAAEFIERLQRIYLRANAMHRSPADTAIKPMMGLVTMGHSFGGQVLLKSVARPIEYDLVERAQQVPDLTRPPVNTGVTEVRVAVDSFGDLNILLNPATEAYQFARIDELYRQLKFPSEQTPQLVVFSADNDVAREAFFPVARVLTAPFRPGFRNSFQGALYGQALGVLPAQQSHTMVHAQAGTPDSLTAADYLDNEGNKVKQFDFSGDVVFDGIRLERMGGAAAGETVIRNSPASMVLVHEQIIDGHDGIFRPEFQQFLASYVTFIEGKRLMLRYDRFKASLERTCPSPR
ncbi:hypothetical protein MX031_24270 [Ralstonia solanacearum]|uniref:hypothetical protein n=1 Tax=Ralstonia solanacearum TaxID=305 RepID=UPI002029F751|nr:hypothetical protein [Ralstonia solanacearum]MCL9861873.1 hypothetical protein [Ralstonia solanacearum]MCM2263524.1 hypothetical protein [Ralstonia solanacearum]